MNWLEAISQLSRNNQDFVLITVLDTQGSSPRNRQSKMVVTVQETHDTIGGGNLEFQAINHARKLMDCRQPGNDRQRYTLGKDLSQCCGGRVELLYECFPACDFEIALFGAGHVGRALIPILAGLPCRISWFDSREDVLCEAVGKIGEFANVRPRVLVNPHEAMEILPADAWYLVMTHSHAMDFELVEAILTRQDFSYCGLIGSRSKAASFRRKLSRRGFSDEELARLTSPVGVDLGGGKWPMEVAVSIAAQLLRQYRTQAVESGELTLVSS